MVPKKNQREAEKVGVLPIIGVDNLKEAVQKVEGIEPEWKKTVKKEAIVEGLEIKGEDFQDIRGQEQAKRAAEIAVSGFHNLLLIGPPGSGKSMLAKRVAGILPPLTAAEALEVSSIYSIAGLLSEENPILYQRPFRAPHHSITAQALTGGGQMARPGEISLAHRGILFLDELPEFNRQALEILRQPLEERRIVVGRSQYNMEFPADFLLLAAMNPCKCGYYPDFSRCTCTQTDIHRYLHKISHPLLDRMDLGVDVERVPFQELNQMTPQESSETIKKRVKAVHELQRLRYRRTRYRFNGDLDAAGVARYCPLAKKEELLLEKIYQKFSLTARGCHRLLKVSRTLADMEGSERILERHLAEAVSYRTVDKKYWK